MSQLSSPIFQAALTGDVEVLREHLAAKDAATPEGYTPLGLAVSAGHNEAVRILLREGVDVNASDNEGVTALMHAAMHGYADVIDLLLLHGARPMQLRGDGQAAPGLGAARPEPAAATIQLYEGMGLEASVRDLANFDYVWLVYLFHANESWKPLVALPPDPEAPDGDEGSDGGLGLRFGLERVDLRRVRCLLRCLRRHLLLLRRPHRCRRIREAHRASRCCGRCCRRRRSGR